MKFIELSGKQLYQMADGSDLTPQNLKAAGVTEENIVRINEQGDIEVRRPDGWDVVGGLIGDFKQRLKKVTNLNWA